MKIEAKDGTDVITLSANEKRSLTSALGTLGVLRRYRIHGADAAHGELSLMVQRVESGILAIDEPENTEE